MARAIVVSGYRSRSAEPDTFARILNRMFNLEVFTLAAAEMGKLGLKHALYYFMSAGHKMGEPILLAYIGHGVRSGWLIEGHNGDYVFEYKDIARIIGYFSEKYGPVLIYNDCCRSWLLTHFLDREHIDKDRVGAILATDRDRTAYAWDLLTDLLRYWRAGMPYKPGIVREESDISAGFEPISVVRNGVFTYYVDAGVYLIRRLIFILKKSLVEKETDIVTSARWGAVLDEIFYVNFKRDAT